MSQARTDSLLAPRTQPRIFATLTTGDLVRRTNVSIRIGRPEGPTGVVMFPVLPVKAEANGRNNEQVHGADVAAWLRRNARQP
jgi:hypothetical protein